jgi:hypothetical protein
VECLGGSERFRDLLLTFAGKWMELENIVISEVTRSRKPKAACFPSYMEYRLNKNTSNVIKTGHAKGRSLTGEGG